MIIRLTQMYRDLTKEAQQRYDEVQKKIDLVIDSDSEPRDSLGNTAEYYKDLGIEVPEELKEKENPVNYIEVDLEKDYVTKEAPYLLNTDFVEDFQEVEDGVIAVFLSKREIKVKQNIEEIQKLINKK